jgi:hypothetical protein
MSVDEVQVVDRLPNKHKALGSILSTKKKKKKKVNESISVFTSPNFESIPLIA